MDASALTRIRRGLALAAKGPVTLPGSRTGDAVPEARFATAAVQYRGVEVKPCCESNEPLLIQMTFNPTRAFDLDFPIIVFGSGRIDLGDGVLVPYSSQGNIEFRTLQGTTVTMYSNDPASGVIYNGSLLTGLVFGENGRFQNVTFFSVGASGNVGQVNLNSNIFSASAPLTIYNQSLTSLNLGNAVFTGLNLNNNLLTILDLSTYTTLTGIDVGINPFTSLILPASNPHLQSLNVYDCSLNALTPSLYPSLVNLSCGKNRITHLDVSGLSNLVDLECSGNGMTSLTITGCTSLLSLLCANNTISQEVANQILLDLDTYGQEGGTLSFEDNSPTLYYNNASEVEDAYNSLIDKGWTITGLSEFTME